MCWPRSLLKPASTTHSLLQLCWQMGVRAWLLSTAMFKDLPQFAESYEYSSTPATVLAEKVAETCQGYCKDHSIEEPLDNWAMTKQQAPTLVRRHSAEDVQTLDTWRTTKHDNHRQWEHELGRTGDYDRSWRLGKLVRLLVVYMLSDNERPGNEVH